MYKKLTIVLFAILTFTVSSSAQFQKGDTEISLSGTAVHMFTDSNVEYSSNSTRVTLQVGFGKFVTPYLQIGIQPTWNYTRYKTTYMYFSYSSSNSTREKRTYSDSEGIFGVNLFANYNIKSRSKLVPYFAIQYQVPDVERVSDFDSLGLGVGLRYFLIKSSAINTTLFYDIPLDDSDTRYNTLSAFLGISIFL